MSLNRGRVTRISEAPRVNEQRAPLSIIEEEGEIQGDDVHHMVLPNSVNVEPIPARRSKPRENVASLPPENKEALCNKVIRLIVHTAMSYSHQNNYLSELMDLGQPIDRSVSSESRLQFMLQFANTVSETLAEQSSQKSGFCFGFFPVSINAYDNYTKHFFELVAVINIDALTYKKIDKLAAKMRGLHGRFVAHAVVDIDDTRLESDRVLARAAK